MKSATSPVKMEALKGLLKRFMPTGHAALPHPELNVPAPGLVQGARPMPALAGAPMGVKMIHPGYTRR